jgi:hypothetical protein
MIIADGGDAPAVDGGDVDGGDARAGDADPSDADAGSLPAVDAAAGAMAAMTGAVRVFAHTARGLALDLVSATARSGEAAADLLSRRLARPHDAPRDIRGAARGLATVRVNVLILSDERGQPLTTPDRLAPSLALADRVFSGHAGIRIRRAAVRTVTDPAPTAALDPHADRGLLRDEIVGRTAFYRQQMGPRTPLSVVGDPVTVIVVRDIAGRATGCSLGVTADWVVVEASLFDPDDPHHYDETVLAHELGHALNLPHHRDRGNLMSGVSSPPTDVRGTRLVGWQAALLQANRHTIPAG